MAGGREKRGGANATCLSEGYPTTMEGAEVWASEHFLHANIDFELRTRLRKVK